MLQRQARPLARVVAARLEKGCRWHCGGPKGPAEGANVMRGEGSSPGIGKQETGMPAWLLAA